MHSQCTVSNPTHSESYCYTNSVGVYRGSGAPPRAAASVTKSASKEDTRGLRWRSAPCDEDPHDPSAFCCDTRCAMAWSISTDGRCDKDATPSFPPPRTLDLRRTLLHARLRLHPPTCPSTHPTHRPTVCFSLSSVPEPMRRMSEEDGHAKTQLPASAQGFVDHASLSDRVEPRASSLTC